jgi:RNA polymerase sigma factor (sigma-70 family)
MEAHAVPRPHAGLVPQRLLRLADDDRLVALVRAGNERAFEAIYDRHHRPILSFCRHMLGSRDEAEDAVQQTFLSAYRDIVASDKPLSLRAWLFTIARNRCLSMLRTRREQVDIDDVEPATEGLADAVQRREDLKQMLGDLQRLPADQREALVLSELGALPHDEVAAVIGCQKDKVKALVFQARSSLASSRQARETSCTQIREELSTASGGALRRAHLRRHLRDCAGCREFRDQVKHQRVAMALLLPVIPTAALKHASLPNAVAAASTAGGGGAMAALGGKGLAAKALAIAAVAGAGTAGGIAVVKHASSSSGSAGASHSAAAHAAAARAAAARTAGALVSRRPSTPPQSASANGLTPQTKAGKGGNAAAAHALALTRGRGLKRGLNGTAPGRNGSHPNARRGGTRRHTPVRHRAFHRQTVVRDPVTTPPAKSTQPADTTQPSRSQSPLPPLPVPGALKGAKRGAGG